MCNCWCERWFPEPKCTCTLVGRCRCWLEFVAWWKTKLSPQVQICQRWLYSRIMILAVPTLEENIVLIQSSLFTLMIIVVCKLDYLMYIKYVNTGDSSLTAERSFFLYFYFSVSKVRSPQLSTLPLCESFSKRSDSSAEEN